MRSARALALEVLLRVEGGAYSNLALPAALARSGLSGPDRAFATDLVYGTLRAQGQADHLISLVADRPVSSLDPPLRAALRLGAYQLLGGTPPHAAVSATVSVLTGPYGRARGYANAVLRRLSERIPGWEWPAGDEPEALGLRTSHPAWIAELLVRDLGTGDAEAVLASANTPAPVTLRPNPLRGTGVDLACELGAFEARPGRLVPGAVLVSGAGDPGALAPVAQGRATPQDEASQAVVAAVAARPGERILDVAAAPGGKATGMAEAMGDEGLVVAGDVRPGRLAWARRALHRLGLASVVPLVADGTQLPFPDASFDRVLVDAPCSGLGVLRRRPESRWRVTPADVERLAAVQRDLLAAAATVVRPGGLLAYCVCTLTAAETTMIDAWAESALAAFEPEGPLPAPWRPHGRGALLLPSDMGTDGMFVLLLRRIRP